MKPINASIRFYILILILAGLLISCNAASSDNPVQDEATAIPAAPTISEATPIPTIPTATPVSTSSPAAPTKIPTEIASVTPTEIIPEITPTSTPAPLPFEAATFRSDPFGFEFDYPADWTVSNLGAIGSRGSAMQFLDGDRVAMQMTFYLWDPKYDLPAYIDQRQTAWAASDMTVLAEEDWLLEADHPAASFVIQGQGDDTAYFFYTTIADRYLELSGDEEIDLLATIAGTMRLFEPVVSSDAAGALGCLTAVTQTAENVACNVMDGIRSRNTAALPSFMTDSFMLGYWQSEGIAISPAEAVAELGSTLLPADPGAYPLTFTTDRSQFPPLQDIPLEGMFGPNVAIDHVIYSEGWGQDGQGAALIFIAHNDDRFYWHGLIFSPEHFDK